MDTNLLIVWIVFLAVFLLLLALDLLRGRKSIFGKYIDKSNNLYDFAENISMFVPNINDDLKKEELKTQLMWSGDVLGVSVEGYYALRIILGALGFVLGLILYPFGITPLIGVLLGVLLSILPLGVIRSSIEKRQLQITVNLPNVVNLLSTAVGAGIELGPALEAVSYNTPGVLGEVLRDAWKEIATGKSRAEVLKSTAKGTGVPMFERFVESIIVAEERGGMELSKSLTEFSLDMRHMERKFLEERAKKIPTKMLMPLFTCIFIPMLLLLLAPILLSVFANI